MAKNKIKKKKKEYRTALQEFGRDQLKLFQAASSTQLGSKLNLLVRATTKALSGPNTLLHVCGCPVCTERACVLIALSAQSSAGLLLKQYVSLNLKTSQAISLPHLLRQTQGT